MDVLERGEFLRYDSPVFAGYALYYALFKPTHYDPAQRYPVVLFLHGAGERGANKTLLMQNCIREFFETRPALFENAFLLCPQCPCDEQWVDTPWTEGCYSTAEIPESRAMQTAWAILEQLLADYSCDTDRIYVYGLSMGGYGTWDVLARHGETIAAAVPLCGGGDIAAAESIKDIPIWTWHSRDDGAVRFIGTVEMVEAIRRCGGTRICFSDMNGFGHNVWHVASASGSLLDWLFAQKKS